VRALVDFVLLVVLEGGYGRGDAEGVLGGEDFFEGVVRLQRLLLSRVLSRRVEISQRHERSKRTILLNHSICVISLNRSDFLIRIR